MYFIVNQYFLVPHLTLLYTIHVLPFLSFFLFLFCFVSYRFYLVLTDDVRDFNFG